MNQDDSLSPWEVFEGTAWEAGLLKSILDDVQIESIIRDNSRVPWNTFPVAASSVKVFVAKADLEKALTVVEEFRSNLGQEPDFDPEEE